MIKSAIILVNYNGAGVTLECLESLKGVRGDFDVVIVDNKSKEEDYRLLEDGIQGYPFARKLLRSEKNLGFAGGNNIGIRYALEELQPEVIILLNNDTAVQPEFLEALLAPLKEDGISASTPKVVFADEPDLLWAAGGNFNDKYGIGANRFFRQKDEKEADVSCEVNFTPFCCIAFKKEVFEKLGLLEESYFMYFEDCDYCKKMAAAGMKIRYTPATTVYHKVSASTGGFRSDFYLEWMTRNQKKFIRLYYSKKTMFHFKMKSYMKICYFLLKFKFSSVKSILKGLK